MGSKGERWKLFAVTVRHRERITCVSCRDILLEPQQGDCGCRFCRSCLETELKQGVTICRTCNEDLCASKRGPVSDTATEKEILNLEVSCTNIPCGYRCRLMDMISHLDLCDYRTVSCDQCGESYPYKMSNEHRSVTCLMVRTTCTECGQGSYRTRGQLSKEHRNVTNYPFNMGIICDQWKGICPFDCGDASVNIKDHLSICERVPVECELKLIGCTVRLPRAEMEGHNVTDAYRHIQLLGIEVLKLKDEHLSLRGNIVESEGQNNNELSRLSDVIRDSQLNVDSLNQSIIKLGTEVDALNASFNGPMELQLRRAGFWKIDNIAEKIIRAKNGVDRQIFGEPFYTDSPKYRIRVKVYPNGDGLGFGTHLSIFFAIVKGDFDNDIPWPFRQKLSISLMSYRSGSQTRVVNMKPDINESCYGRPTTNSNVAAGQPTFISHEELLNSGVFLKDGSIIVQVRVMKGS